MPSPRTQALLAALTIEEQIALLAGRDFWSTVPIERLNIPSVKVSDGPNGARGGGGLIGGVTAAAFPVGIAVAATWNRELVKEIGAALAKEALSKGARALLAPTVNLHRSSLNGRNFECYSEDPYLTGEIAVAYITGLQGAGVAATIKHFIGNESEYQRNSMSSDIDERTLRELYLVPFEAAVKRAKTLAIMTSYNRLHGTYVSEIRDLLATVVRREWGYDGLFMSDWFGTQSTAAGVNAGLDLEMPGPAKWRGQKLVDAHRAGEVPAERIREAAGHVLDFVERVGGFANPETAAERAEDLPETRALIRRAGAEAAVLLKNDGVLPLASPGKIAVIGPNAATARIMGGGSAQLNPHYRVSPLDGLKAAPSLHNSQILHAVGCANDRLVGLHEQDWTVEYFNSRDFSGAPVHVAKLPDGQFMHLGGDSGLGFNGLAFSARASTTLTLEHDSEVAFGVIASGPTKIFADGALVVDDAGWRLGNEFFDMACDEMRGVKRLAKGVHTIVFDYRSADTTGTFQFSVLRPGVKPVLGDAEIERAVALAAESDVALLFVGTNAEWDGEGIDRPNLDLPGRQAELIERVAAVNAKTIVVLQSGAPIVMPWLDKVSAVLECWYPGQEAGNSIADVLTGAAEPGGRLTQTFPMRLEDDPTTINYPGELGHVRYGEGIYIGYRYYEKKRVKPLFPFGHGLSYSSFTLGALTLAKTSLGADDQLTAHVDVTNTGARADSTVVQFYVTDEAASVSRPAKELKGFAKVHLKAGETRKVEVGFDRRALAYFDVKRTRWSAERGAFTLHAGFSSADIAQGAAFTLERDWFDDAPAKARAAAKA